MLWAPDAIDDPSCNFALIQAASASLEHRDTDISAITQRHLHPLLFSLLALRLPAKRRNAYMVISRAFCWARKRSHSLRCRAGDTPTVGMLCGDVCSPLSPRVPC